MLSFEHVHRHRRRRRIDVMIKRTLIPSVHA